MTKRRLAGLCLLLVLATGAWAQERGGFSAPPGGTPMRMGQPSGDEMKKMKDERQKWLTSLKLTPEQKKRWDEIEVRYSKLLKEKFAKQGGSTGRIMISGDSGDAMKAIQEIQTIQKKKRDEQRALLKPAQQAAFDKAPDPGFRTRTITR